MAGAPAGLTFLDRARLLTSASDGSLDRDTVAWAQRAMDACGIPDGLPVITSGSDVFEPAWRWQRTMPQATAASTRMRYMRDVRRLLEFLASERVEFEHTTSTELRAYALERRSVAEATWSTEEAALMSFFRFCTLGDETGWKVFDRNPWPLWRTAAGERSALRRPPDTLPAAPRFLDDDELRHFLVAGVQALDPADGTALPDDWEEPAPLLPARDLAFALFVLATGARMTEARLTLIDEIPTDEERHPWPSVWMRLGGERAKTRGGEVPFDPHVATLIGRWYRSELRADLVDRAQPNLTAMQRAGQLFVVDDTAKVGTELTWRGTWRGRKRRFTTTTLPRPAAHHAVRIVDGRVEPLTLWQGWRTGGLPASADAFEDALRDASRRAALHPACPFSDHLRPTRTLDVNGRVRTRGGVTAHMLRHTAAVRWLVELEQELQRRRAESGARTPGLPPGTFNSLLLVQAWLRHRRHSTTERYLTCYLSRRWVERALGESLRMALASPRR